MHESNEGIFNPSLKQDTSKYLINNDLSSISRNGIRDLIVKDGSLSIRRTFQIVNVKPQNDDILYFYLSDTQHSLISVFSNECLNACYSKCAKEEFIFRYMTFESFEMQHTPSGELCFYILEGDLTDDSTNKVIGKPLPLTWKTAFTWRFEAVLFRYPNINKKEMLKQLERFFRVDFSINIQLVEIFHKVFLENLGSREYASSISPTLLPNCGEFKSSEENYSATDCDDDLEIVGCASIEEMLRLREAKESNEGRIINLVDEDEYNEYLDSSPSREPSPTSICSKVLSPGSSMYSPVSSKGSCSYDGELSP